MTRTILAFLMVVGGSAACSTNKPPESQNTDANNLASTTESSPSTMATPQSGAGNIDGTVETASMPPSPGTFQRGSKATSASAPRGNPVADNNSAGMGANNNANSNPNNTAPAAAPGAAPAPRSDADNTKNNARDRNAAAVTPGDQGNSDSDMKITQMIRKAVVGDKSLSFSAKNVKIITINKKVTLRGAVSNEQERMQIETYARGSGTDVPIDNQIEVKKLERDKQNEQVSGWYS